MDDYRGLTHIPASTLAQLIKNLYPMNLEHAAKIINASNNGEDVQFREIIKWETIHFSNIHAQDRFSLRDLNDPNKFRIKPKDQYRPLTIKDLPPACWVSHPTWDGTSCLVVKANRDGVMVALPPENHPGEYTFLTFNELFHRDYTYTTVPDPTANPELCRKLITE